MTGEAQLRDARTVLIVDDEADVLEAMRRILARRGFTVHTAPGAEEALDIARAVDGAIGLLVTDLCLPGDVSGVRLAGLLTELVPDVRVLFVSGYPREVAVDKGLIGSDVDILEKPFDPSLLSEAVQAALGPRQAAGASRVEDVADHLE